MAPSASPSRPTLRRSLALVWRTLRSMRTALVLLLLLALAQIPGSLLPQTPNSPERVQRYLADHPVLGELFWRAGLFDVFGSWWFALITVLLFTSLVACLLPRSRAAVRAIGQPPVHVREIDAFPLYQERTVSLPPAEATRTAVEVLRRRRFRVAAGERSVAGEKGALRDLGSLVFHWAFVLLIVGVVVGKGTGYSGRATLAEGETWVDTAATYDGTLRSGRFFDGGHTGTGIRLLSFEDTFRSSGVPMDFVSHVELLDAEGHVVRTDDVRINHPVEFGGLRFFQFGFGWAPVVRVEDGGQTIADGPLIMGQEQAPSGVSQLAMPWIGVVKLPSLRPQIAVQLELWPDSAAYLRSLQTGEPQAMVAENAPFMRYTVWRGRLLDLSRGALDTSLMRQIGSGVVGAGQTVDLSKGCVVGAGAGSPGELPANVCTGEADPALAMTFADLRRYSVLQVTRDVGVPIVLLAAILLLLGLLPALYTSRRKLWVRAEPVDGGTLLKVGGFALQRKAQFEEEFAKVVEAIVRASSHTRDREMVGAP
jgi:cytochrome c biogenesis protein